MLLSRGAQRIPPPLLSGSQLHYIRGYKEIGEEYAYESSVEKAAKSCFVLFLFLQQLQMYFS